MLLRLLRFIAFALLFYFLYRVIVGAFRYLSRDSKRQKRVGSQAPQEPKKKDEPGYRDVKDAEFKDLPDDSSKPT